MEELVWLKRLKNQIQPNSVEEYELFTLISQFGKLRGLVKRQKENEKVLLSHIQVKRNEFKKHESHLTDIMSDETQRKIARVNNEISDVREKLHGLSVECGNYESQINQLQDMRARKTMEVEDMANKKIKAIDREIHAVEKSISDKEEIEEKKLEERLTIQEETENLQRDLKEMNDDYTERRKERKELIASINTNKNRPKLLDQRLNVSSGKMRRRETTIRIRLKDLAQMKIKISKKEKLKNKMDDEVIFLNKRADKEDRLVELEKIELNTRRTLLIQKHAEKEHVIRENRRLLREYMRKKLQLETLNSDYKRFRGEMQNLKKEISSIEKRRVFIVSETETLGKTMVNKHHRKREIIESFKKSKLSLTKMDDDVTVLLNDNIIDAKKGKMVRRLIKKTREEMNELSGRIELLLDEEKVVGEKLTNMNKKRNNFQNEIRVRKKLFVNLVSEGKTLAYECKELEKEYVILKKQHKEIKVKIKCIDDQKIKFSKTIGDHSHHVRVFRRERELLNSEVRVITRQALEKEKNLLKLRVKTNSVLCKNESMISKQSKFEEGLENCRDVIDEYKSTINRLLDEISYNEKEIEIIKRQADDVASDRQSVGLEMVKNAKLIAMYEKNDTNDLIIKEGIVEIMEKKKLLRQLQIVSRDYETETMIQVRKLPLGKELEAKLSQREQEFEELRGKLQEIEFKLANPKDNSHIREIKSKFPPIGELKCLIEEISTKIRFNKEQLSEKSIILNELSRSSDKLRKMSINLRNRVSKGLSVGLSDIHSRIRKENSRMKSTLSEISIYEATLYTMKTKNGNLKVVYEDLDKGLKGNIGEIPKCIVEKYYRMKIAKERLIEAQMNAEQQMVTKTTTVLRPNSYIPYVVDKLPLPVPYHSWARPVFPTKIGANIRHIRNPKEKELNLFG